MLEIREARITDVTLVMDIIDKARQIMRASGNLTQWVHGYPSSDVICADIQKGNGFVVCSEEQLVGYFAFIQGDDPTYTYIENGAWKNELPYGVIHRLASDGTHKGVATACFNFAFRYVSTIRVDTNHTNLPMQQFLRKYGFEYCGIIYVSDGSPRDAFLLSKE